MGDRDPEKTGKCKRGNIRRWRTRETVGELQTGETSVRGERLGRDGEGEAR